MLEAEGGGLHLCRHRFLITPLFLVDVVNVLADALPLLALEPHQGLQFFPLLSPRFTQILESVQRLTRHWIFAAKAKEVQVHVEAEGQWDFELVILTTCPLNDAIQIVPIDLASIVDVAVIVTSWEAIVALIALHSDKRKEKEASRS